MANSYLSSRIIHKHDTAENWAKATNFIPLEGEIIVYSDLNKIKIGDGVTNVNDLDFIENENEIYIGDTAPTNDSLIWVDTGELGFSSNEDIEIAYNHAVAKGNRYSNGLYKITTNSEGHVTEAVSATKEDIIELGVLDEVPHATPDWSISDSSVDGYIANKPGEATTLTAGLLSPTDKAKLDTVAENASSVSYVPTLTDGQESGKIIINGNIYTIFSSIGNKITISDQDLEAGVSALEEGEIYLVYE